MEKINLIVPKISSHEYKKMDYDEFDNFCSDITKKNKTLFKQITNNDPSISWVIIVGNKIVDSGSGIVFPSKYQVMEYRNGRNLPFLLGRVSENYNDLKLYAQNSDLENISNLLDKIPLNQTVLDNMLKVSSFNVPSGIINKLRADYALGELNLHKVKIGDDISKNGGIVVMVKNKEYYGKNLYIGCQSKDEVHKRKAKTFDETKNQKGSWYRLERLHRFDISVLDIFDTYNLKRKRSWPNIVLYEPVEKA